MMCINVICHMMCINVICHMMCINVICHMISHSAGGGKRPQASQGSQPSHTFVSSHHLGTQVKMELGI